MNRPDLAERVAYWQSALRLKDWRIKIGYVANLANESGAAVWGLCSPVIDNKTAQILIRDPMTPPPGETTDEAIKQVEETIAHELVHLWFAAFGLSSPSEIAAEEQAVWAISEALVNAKGTPYAARIARALRARLAQFSAPRRARIGGQMDPNLLKEALDAIEQGDAAKAIEILKGLIVAAASGGAAPAPDDGGGEMAPAEAKPGAVPPGGGAPMDQGDQNKPEAVARRAREAEAAHHASRMRTASASMTRDAIRSKVHAARVVDGLELPPSVEKRILAAETLEAAETLLETAREMGASNPAAAVRERSGENAGNRKPESNTDGLEPHEVETYQGMLADGRKPQAESYLASAKRNRMRLVAKGGAQ